MDTSASTDASLLRALGSSFLHTVSPRNPRYLKRPGPEKEGSDEGDGLRRSKRATQGRRFAFWKGEGPVYEKVKRPLYRKAPPSHSSRRAPWWGCWKPSPPPPSPEETPRPASLPLSRPPEEVEGT